MTAWITRTAVTLACTLPCLVTADEFSFQDVIDKAEALAAKSWQAPPQVPRFLQELSYHDYQGIRFKPERTLWLDGDSQFGVMLIPPGLFYHHAVRINVIDGDQTEPLNFDKSLFDYPNAELEKLVPADLVYAGFKLTFAFTEPDAADEVLGFPGAGDYRAVGRDRTVGRSGRGIEVNAGLPGGEEFPAFVEFCLEQPDAVADSLTFYGLLDGRSQT